MRRIAFGVTPLESRAASLPLQLQQRLCGRAAEMGAGKKAAMAHTCRCQRPVVAPSGVAAHTQHQGQRHDGAMRPTRIARFELRPHSSSGSDGGGGADGTRVGKSKYTILQFPARSLWSMQAPIDLEDLRSGECDQMLKTLRDARKYYQFPGLSAPQIGWNVRAFVLFDGSTWINPELLDTAADSSWAWEPCASCTFSMYYIERPTRCTIRALDATGRAFTKELTGWAARQAQHEMDHMNGVLFTSRAPNNEHVVPMDGFFSMSDWPTDFPSLEARSTYLYNIFTPPYFFEACSVPDANIFDRIYGDRVFPAADEFNELNDLSSSIGLFHKQTRDRLRQEHRNAAEDDAPSAASMDEMKAFENDPELQRAIEKELNENETSS